MALSLRGLSCIRRMPVRHCLLTLKISPGDGKISLENGILANTLSRNALQTVIKREMSAKRLMVIHPPRFAWRRFKRDAHMFIMLGVIPLTLFTLYCNVWIGPAELVEIPEGYYPKEHEYYKNPVSRLIIQYLQDHQQKGYEQVMHHLSEEVEKARLGRLQYKVEALQAERHDFQGHLHSPGRDSLYEQFVHDKTNTNYEENIDGLRPHLGG